MRSNDLAQLKGIIKDFGIKKIETIIRGTLGINYDSYFDHVEPIYALARCYPYFNTDKDKERITNADKVWVKYVIKNNQCSPILPYVQREGMERIIQAVQYLIENHLWDAPKGNSALKTKKVDNYKGLKDIDEAINYLDSEGLLPEKEETPEVLDFVEPEKQEEKEEELSDNPFSNAKKSLECLLKAVDDINQQVPYIQKVFDGNNSQADVVDKLTKEFDDSMQKMRDENLELTKTKKRLTDEKATLNARNSAFAKELESTKGICSDLRKQLNLAQTELNDLKKWKEEHDKPRRRIIPESKLLDLALVGPKTINQLEGLFADYEIIIDHAR